MPRARCLGPFARVPAIRARAPTAPVPPRSWLKTKRLSELDAEDFVNIKRKGFSDSQIGRLTGARASPDCAQARKRVFGGLCLLRPGPR